jgi:hypothetical protein
VVAANQFRDRASLNLIFRSHIMRTHNYAFLLALIAVSAEGADFRAPDIGQSCATVVEWEIAHGSTPVPWTTVPGAETYAFRVRQFDRDILAQYVCVKGNLLAGNYLFPVESLDQAVDSYREIHSRLLAVYGIPSADNSPWSDNVDSRVTSLYPQQYMTIWIAARETSTISLMPNKKSESVGWRVFLVIGAARR